MKARKIAAIIVIALLTAAAVICIVLIVKIKANDSGKIVIISQDGKELYRLDLEKEDDKKITLTYESRENVIEIRGGRIRMYEADCPDHTCINTGWLEDTPIICLPNKIVIEYADDDNIYLQN